jgi:phosphatidylserine/phosphatidylglycerophosphate/cardiolipin synthase-like enzyme
MEGAAIDADVHFGGPDRPPRALRDLLEQHVEAVPAGGSIDWMTYYFRDEALADALVRAHERGVAVRVCVEGRPRNRRANDRVIALLKRGIGKGLRVEKRLFGASHLHSKLYAFSHPRPHALIGSFNPSGNEPEDAAVIADIGDQDRGHNLLVELGDRGLVTALGAHVGAVHAGANPFGGLASGSDIHTGGVDAIFFPRRSRNPLDQRVARLGPGARLRIAASHVRDPSVARQLAKLASAGVEVDLLTHHTRRRSPDALLERMRSAGVRICRYQHPEALPMHAKFILAEDGGERWCALGSYNLTRTSRWLNQELLVFTSDPGLWDALNRRWTQILAEPWCKP